MRVALLIAAVFLIGGCAAGGFTRDFSSRPLPNPSARLVMFRGPQAAIGIAAYVILDGELIGALGYRQKIMIPVTAGRHSFGLPSAQVTVDAQIAHTYFFLVDQAFWTGEWNIFPLTETQAATWDKEAIDVSGKVLTSSDLPSLDAPIDRK